MKNDIKDIAWRVIDDEVIAFDVSRGNYYSFNKTGSQIWQLLAQGRDRKEIISNIAGKFDVSYGKAEKDIADFLAYLSKEKLIKERIINEKTAEKDSI